MKISYTHPQLCNGTHAAPFSDPTPNSYGSHNSSLPNISHSMFYPSLKLHQAIPAKPQVTPAREIGMQPADLYLFFSSSISNPLSNLTQLCCRKTVQVSLSFLTPSSTEQEDLLLQPTLPQLILLHMEYNS